MRVPSTTEIYTLSLHDALPISVFGRQADDEALASLLPPAGQRSAPPDCFHPCAEAVLVDAPPIARSEEHTSELQSLTNLVCRLLLEKKKSKIYIMSSGDMVVLS